MKVSDVRREEEPHDRLTWLAWLANEMIEMARTIGPRNLQAVVLLRNADDEGRAATAYDGFENDNEAFAYMLVHLKALALARGSDLIVAPLRRG